MDISFLLVSSYFSAELMLYPRKVHPNHDASCLAELNTAVSADENCATQVQVVDHAYATESRDARLAFVVHASGTKK